MSRRWLRYMFLAIVVIISSGNEPVQVEYRLSMLCEPSGFITEGVDFLAALDAILTPQNFTIDDYPIDLALTGLYGDCHSLLRSMSEGRQTVVHKLRAFDSSYNDPGASKNAQDSCMITQTDGVYHYVCDGYVTKESGLSSARPIQLRVDRIAIEHGLICQLRPRGGHPREKFEALYGAIPDIVVARIMTEANQLSEREVMCLQDAAPDRLWVPSEWHREVFASSGVIDAEKIDVIPEIVDVDSYAKEEEPPTSPNGEADMFVFLSVFKWEWRKGWDVLLLGYWKAFYQTEYHGKVLLKIKTFRPRMGLLSDVYMESSVGTVSEEIAFFAQGLMGVPVDQLPRIEVLEEFLPEQEIRGLYHSANAFVLPTRGEGWGLPIVEAMAVGLPVLVTNYSGPTAYLTPANSYQIEVESIDPQGYAAPSLRHLIHSLREVVQNPSESRLKGSRAQEDMREKFNPMAVGTMMIEKIKSLVGDLRHVSR